MNLQDVKTHDLKLKRGRRVGRGPGSGRGCTSGRGMNGQGSRSGVGGGLAHEGGQMPLFRRLPKRGFTNSDFRVEWDIVNVEDLARAFPKGGTVDLATVKAARLVKKKATGLKVLGKGDISVAISLKADRISESARAKIEAAGGSIALSAGAPEAGAPGAAN